MEEWKIGPETYTSRFFLGSGKTAHYTKELIDSAVQRAGAEMISVAVKTLDTEDSPLSMIPEGIRILPNTLGAHSVEDAVRMAHIAKEKGLGNRIKIEIMTDSRYFLPDPHATVDATEILAKEGFLVFPYFYPELRAAKQLVQAGAAALMPLASPSGSNKGLQTRDFIEDLIRYIDLPVIVDAGIGCPSQACEAMELGCAGVMANTALVTAENLGLMAEAFRLAIAAGHAGYLSHRHPASK
jgi:thiazole synthase